MPKYTLHINFEAWDDDMALDHAAKAVAHARLVLGPGMPDDTVPVPGEEGTWDVSGVDPANGALDWSVIIPREQGPELFDVVRSDGE